MAHLAPPTGRHRHREQLLGLVLLLVGASMALLAITALIHPKSRPASLTPVAGESPQPSAGAEPVSAASAGSTPGPAPVIVLQNTGDLELAGSVAASFAAGGWTVTETSTFNGDSSSTAAYYDPAVAGAQAAAAALQSSSPGSPGSVPSLWDCPRGRSLSSWPTTTVEGAQLHSSAHPEGQRDRPVEAPATTTATSPQQY